MSAAISGPDCYSVVELFEGSRRSTLGLTYDDLILMPGNHVQPCVTRL
jgi:hypothetical protein